MGGSASAPGVSGSSAPAQAVTPLPGAVDEAQGVFELLVGGLLQRLVGQVHLVDVEIFSERWQQGLVSPELEVGPRAMALHSGLKSCCSLSRGAALSKSL